MQIFEFLNRVTHAWLKAPFWFGVVMACGANIAILKLPIVTALWLDYYRLPTTIKEDNVYIILMMIIIIID